MHIELNNIKYWSDYVLSLKRLELKSKLKISKSTWKRLKYVVFYKSLTAHFVSKPQKRLDSKITSYKINGDSSSDNEICHNDKDVN